VGVNGGIFSGAMEEATNTMRKFAGSYRFPIFFGSRDISIGRAVVDLNKPCKLDARQSLSTLPTVKPVKRMPLGPEVVLRDSPDTLRSLVEAAGWENAEQYDLFDRVSVLYIPLGYRGFLMGATVITFQLGNLDDSKTYSVVYTPHGSSVATLQATIDSLNTLPHHECLAIISNFDLVHTPPFGLAQPGKENGLILLKLLNPKFWLRTHGRL